MQDAAGQGVGRTERDRLDQLGRRSGVFPPVLDSDAEPRIDVLLSEQRDTAAARRFFAEALARRPPVEVTTDKAGPYVRVIDELVPATSPSSTPISC